MPLPTPSPSGGFLRPLGMGIGNREALAPKGDKESNVAIHSVSFPYGPEPRKGAGAALV